MELYLYSPYMLLWRCQGKLYLCVDFINIYSMQHASVSFLLQNLQLIAHDLLSVLNFSKLGLSKQLKLSGGNRNFIACLVILPVYPICV